MVKQHMSSIDVAAQVACLNQKLLGLRVANIYDLNAKTYLLKLARSGGDGEKVFLVLESGVRFHTTQVLRDKSDVPSNFSLKLRKHIRTKRLESVRQLGVDRIVDFTFGSGEATVHLILELYAQGNIVLADSKYEVLTLLRSHRDDDKNFAVMARHPYPMTHVRLRAKVTAQQVVEAAATVSPGMNLKGLVAQLVGYGPAIAEHVIRDADLDPFMQVTPAASNVAAPEVKKPAKPSQNPEDGNDWGEHEGMDDGYNEEEEGAEQQNKRTGDGSETAEDSKAVAPPTLQLSAAQLKSLDEALQRLDAWFTGLDTAAPPGFITCLKPGEKSKKQDAGGKKAKKKGGGNDAAETKTAASDSTATSQQGPGQPGTDDKKEMLVYNEFHPILMHQFEQQKVMQLVTFNDALDEFFGKFEDQRAELARAEAERSALSKLDKIKIDQSARAAALIKEAEEAELRGSLIEYNLDAVDAVITALNQSLATGMDWHDLERLIKEERKAGNPVAQYIHSLQLDVNRATLLLSNQLDTEDEGDEAAMARKATKVTIELGLTAHANAALHFGNRKKHMIKQAKTVAANEAALKAAEKKAAAALNKVRSAPTSAVMRKPHWFERFAWFITSENYLVISGRDAQQNELIVKRYFKKGDVYVHADLHGASSTIIKNPTPELPIPPGTLQQAGCACVCRSRAWDSKIVTSAWWVAHHQVSKTAPSGEYLPTGSFMIRGKKNFLPPQPLVFGFGFLFKLEPSSIPAHVGERAVRAGVDNDTISLGMTMQDMGPDDDVSDTDLGIPDVTEEGEQGQGEEVSALDRFLSGSYAASSFNRTTSMSTDQQQQQSTLRLSKAALASVGGGIPNAGEVAEQYERYGLEANLDGPEEEPETQGPNNGDDNAGTSGHRHLSAKEKEALRKAKKAGSSGQLQSPPKQQQQQQQQTKTQQQQKAQQQQQPTRPQSGLPPSGKGDGQTQASTNQPVRGKKGKQQKIKEKYADQDEQERQLAVALLGSAGDKKTRADRRKERKERKEANRAAALGTKLGGGDMKEAIAAATRKQYGQDSDSDSEDVSDIDNKDVQSTEVQQTHGGGVVKASEPGHQKEQTNEVQTAVQHTEHPEEQQPDVNPDADSAAEADEVAALLAEENVMEMADEEREKLTVVDSLTGLPRAEDVLLFAVPVCGPYSALQNYKYKVKLTPGTVKKGKAARQAQELLMRGSEVVQREKDLIKAVPEMDMINAMVGTVKLSMPGLAKLKAGDKAAKKSAAKAAAGRKGE